jgi:hypothetical protein
MPHDAGSTCQKKMRIFSNYVFNYFYHGEKVWWGSFWLEKAISMKPVSGQEEELSATGKPISGLVTYFWLNSLACVVGSILPIVQQAALITGDHWLQPR